jgi:hypothetical protein
VKTHVERYLGWLVDQDSDVWSDETAARGISPLHRQRLVQTNLERMTAAWLSSLGERSESIIRWRYGLDGERLSRKKIARRLGLAPERVRQMQTDALAWLQQPPRAELVAPVKALVTDLLGNNNGLMSRSRLDEALRDQMEIGNINPASVVRLLAKTSPDMRWI